MKNKNGFTLIELLVAIAIMLSILGIAIVSFVNVSDKKKEESWETVKGQIELAAEEFFTYNEYLFEGLSDGVEAEISVGKLVQEDYLNKVTNPITGKAVSECMIVKVIKSNGFYKLEVDDSSENSGKTIEECKTGSSLTIKETGAPEILVEKECGSEGNSGWCKKSSDGKGVYVTAESHDAISIQHTISFYNIGVWNPTGTVIEGSEYTDNVNTNGKSVCFLATGSNGAKSSACVDYKIDMDLPNGEVKIISAKGNSYNSKEVNITGNVYDNESGVASVSSNPNVSFDSATGKISLNNHKLFNSFNAESKLIVLNVEDKAGNKNNIESNKYTVYKECTDTKYVDTTTSTTDCTKKCGGKKTTSTYDNYVDANTNKTCPSELVESTDETCTCKEATCPSIEVVTSQAAGAAKDWYNTSVKFKVTTKDDLEWHWLTDNSCNEGTSGCVKIDGKTYIDWNVKENKKIYNDTSITKEGIGRTARVRVINEDGTTKDCSPIIVNIDKQAPKVDLKVAYNEYYNMDKERVGTSKTRHESVSEMPNVKGNVLLCLDKGEVHTSNSLSLTCGSGSEYTVSDNYSTKKEMKSTYYSKALTDTGEYCLFKDDRCDASKIHPFPSKYYLCYTDLAGNKGCDTLNYILYNKAYAGVKSGKFTYGTKGSSYKKLYGWYTYTINDMWDLKGWETEKYSDFNKR